MCFVHFHFEMCFAPQRRALFRHRNFQEWSEAEVFCTFWLRNVLRATTACNFSSLIWPASSAPAALASLLFDPPEPQIIGKTQCFATFLPFRASASSFFLLFLSYSSFFLIFLFSLPLPCSAFHLSILSEVWLLNFLRLCNFYVYIKIVLFWFLWVLANTSNIVKLIFKIICENVIDISVKLVDHFAAIRTYATFFHLGFVCRDEDLHCTAVSLFVCKLINPTLEGNVQRCSRCRARRYTALCTAVVGLADWTHLIINCLIFPMRSSCCMQEVKAGFISSARCAKWIKSWDFLVMQK